MNRKKLLKYAAVLAIPAYFTLNGLNGRYDQTRLEGKPEIVSLFYNRKGETKGILPGVLNGIYGNATGGVVGLVNGVEGNATGGVVGFVNGVEGNATGGFIGFANVVKGNLEHAVQIGILCYAKKRSGPYLQLCVVNMSDDRLSVFIDGGWK
jgi:hypothetical protein